MTAGKSFLIKPAWNMHAQSKGPRRQTRDAAFTERFNIKRVNNGAAVWTARQKR